MNSREKGDQTETIAASFLQNNGYKILARNVYFVGGEIDIVAFKNILTFVEVKSVMCVRDAPFCEPEELFNSRKKRIVLRSINRFISKYCLTNVEWTLDLICLTGIGSGFKLKHYQNVLSY